MSLCCMHNPHPQAACYSSRAPQSWTCLGAGMPQCVCKCVGSMQSGLAGGALCEAKLGRAALTSLSTTQELSASARSWSSWVLMSAGSCSSRAATTQGGGGCPLTMRSVSRPMQRARSPRCSSSRDLTAPSCCLRLSAVTRRMGLRSSKG